MFNRLGRRHAARDGGHDGVLGTSRHVLRLLLDQTMSPEFDYFAWGLAIEWVLGQREVVSIEGDVGTFVLLWSVSASVTDTLPNPLDVPQNVALYSRAV
ncbi:hypothetical protein AaE_004964 [Aphanomyces astaci]|nr:hypothetical protein AaE_004964 [Aphanomyces astaci]